MPFQNGDEIVKIDDVPIADYGQINMELARRADKTITVVVRRAVRNAKGETEDVPITVERNPMQQLGLVMKMGEVKAIQTESPAVKAGFKRGDLITRPAGDPMTLSSRLLHRFGEQMEVTVQRKAERSPMVLHVKPRQPVGYSTVATYGAPECVSSLGVGYEILQRGRERDRGEPCRQGRHGARRRAFRAPR